MVEQRYTVMTFAPVQGFIEKSRKLRDLYGSSFILSYLSKVLLNAAEASGYQKISPATINVTRGTPNQIIVEGEFPETEAKSKFDEAWRTIVEICRQVIEDSVQGDDYHWQRDWNAWSNHTWEFFVEHGKTIAEARRKLSEKKRKRDWIGINWQGESSTLSGADAIAWYGMTDRTHPVDSSMADQTEQLKEFYFKLSTALGEAIIDPDERLSIPELIKRLITLDDVASKLNLESQELPSVELPSRFSDLNRKEENRWSGWFQGDGDGMGQYMKQMAENSQNEAEYALHLNLFSRALLAWGEQLKTYLPPTMAQRNQRGRLDADGQIIYAGGDDFFGVLYPDTLERNIAAQKCVQWFYGFPDIWRRHGHPITVSVGLVWVAPAVPQRDLLQHCREAEKAAKNAGKDRIAIRIVFNSGNYLQWICPWWFLKEVLEAYRDRNGGDNWNQLYEDVATLEARHAFEAQTEVALGLFEIYFKEKRSMLEQHFWDTPEKTGILGNQPITEEENLKALNQWIINLAKVGFHLFT
jgi:CRISPR-associated protein Cmr2